MRQVISNSKLYYDNFKGYQLMMTFFQKTLKNDILSFNRWLQNVQYLLL